VKVVNYLMIAHAAGLVACVTLLKDYKADSALFKALASSSRYLAGGCWPQSQPSVYCYFRGCYSLVWRK
jgi:hypothetical protein